MFQIEGLLGVIVNGLLEGSMYSLLALGITLVFGVMRIVPLAHGDLAIVGGYSAFWLFYLYQIDPYLSLLVVVPLMCLVGLLVYVTLIWPATRTIETSASGSLLATYALGILIMNVELLVWSPNYRQISTQLTVATADFGGGLTVNFARLVSLVSALGLTMIMQVVLKKTKFGRAIRASTEDRMAAMLCGIRYPRLAAITFATGVGIAALAGTLYITIRQIHPSIGLYLTLKAFITLVVGGMGSVPGALISGLLIGVLENVGSFYLGSAYRDVISYGVLLLILVIRPKGLLGR